jgi:hypothetical protein
MQNERMQNMKNEMDLYLDLLVDDELPEEKRAEVLRGMTDGEWRELSLRFLQRQVEKKSVRELMAGEARRREQFIETPAVAGRIGGGWWTGATKLAAVIAITAGAVGITAFVMRHSEGGGVGGPVAQGSGEREMVAVKLPGDVTGDAKGVELQVPVLAHTDGITSDMLLPAEGERGTKQSLVIIRQSDDKAIAVPVSMTNVVWN